MTPAELGDLEGAVLDTLARRALTRREIALAVGRRRPEIHSAVASLLWQGRIRLTDRDVAGVGRFALAEQSRPSPSVGPPQGQDIDASDSPVPVRCDEERHVSPLHGSPESAPANVRGIGNARRGALE